MKTSNIILLAIFATILIWITAGFVTAKNKIKEFVNDHPEAVIQKDVDKERETIKLESFKTVVLNGKGEINIEQANENSFDQLVDDTNTAEVKNDTLYINISGKECNLNVENITSIQTNESTRVDIYDLKADSFNVYTSEVSRVKMKGLNSSLLIIDANGKSKIILRDVNKKAGMKAEFHLKDKSHLEINNTEGMSLSVQKEADAKYEDD